MGKDDVVPFSTWAFIELALTTAVNQYMLIAMPLWNIPRDGFLLIMNIIAVFVSLGSPGHQFHVSALAALWALLACVLQGAIEYGFFPGVDKDPVSGDWQPRLIKMSILSGFFVLNVMRMATCCGEPVPDFLDVEMAYASERSYAKAAPQKRAWRPPVPQGTAHRKRTKK
jgi:hypothetical protein